MVEGARGARRARTSARRARRGMSRVAARVSARVARSARVAAVARKGGRGPPVNNDNARAGDNREERAGLDAPRRPGTGLSWLCSPS